MLRSCKYCGHIHDSKVVCKQKEAAQKQRAIKYRGRNKGSKADKFRWTKDWQSKREDIKQRDKCLCQICIRKLYGTVYQYNYNNLSVHHAVSLNEDYSKRLDDDNLLTVCDTHHEMCESGEIPREVVLKIISEQINISPRP